jgi:hypothetical protein
MRKLWDGWHPLSLADRTRVFIDNGEPACVATRGSNLDDVEDQTAQWWGAPLTFDTWFCPDDSPHAGLVTELAGSLEWTGDWMLAGVDCEEDAR